MLGCVLSRTLIMSLKDDGWAAHGLSEYVVFFEQEVEGYRTNHCIQCICQWASLHSLLGPCDP